MTAGAGAENERLSALAAYDVIDLPSTDPVVADLNAVCELAAILIGTPTAVVNVVDDRTQHQVATYGTAPTACARDESMCQTVLAGDVDLFLPDASIDPRFVSSPWVDGRFEQIRCYHSTILRTPSGHAVGTLCVFDEQPREIGEHQRDALRLLAHQVVSILELRLRSRQLERSNDELSRSQERLASFAGQISHDLKAPITAILGFAELLDDLELVADDPTATAYVGRCTSAARRMLAMIDDLLAFARVGGTLNARSIALDTIMPEVLDDLGAATIGADVSWSGPDVIADSAQLRALLQNLLGNALAYRSDAPCEVRVITERVTQGTMLRVIDNGSGIPVESREEVVRPLVRLRRDITGAGLGLAVCSRIVHAHGGTLRLGDTPGGGTTVTVVLPA